MKYILTLIALGGIVWTTHEYSCQSKRDEIAHLTIQRDLANKEVQTLTDSIHVLNLAILECRGPGLILEE